MGLLLHGCDVAAVAGLGGTEPRSIFGLGHAAGEFTDGAMADALARAGHAPLLAPGEVVAWARAQGLASIVTPWAPIGWRRRNWDEACWPLAQRGFFPFRAEIPRLIAELQPFSP